MEAQQNTDYDITNSYGTNGRARLLMNISDRLWQIENDGNLNVFKIRDESAGKDRFSIDYFGKIGIGTTTPSYLLHLKNISGNAELRTENNNQYAKIGASGAGGYIGASNSNGDLTINIRGYGDAYLNAGKVGIGTATPSSLLHLNSTLQNTDLAISNTYGTLGRNRVLLNITDRTWQIENDGNLNIFKIRDQTVGEDRLNINYNGQVGIGTFIMGTHKLAVEGSIGAREVKVEAIGWSDFVFENNYELRTLEEVERFISENKHLPEIPSEAEVTENGINLGEMDSKLLQKIEELTLYMIDLNKQVQQLRSENNELKNEVSILKN